MKYKPHLSNCRAFLNKWQACYVFKSDAAYTSDRAAKFFSKSRKTLENTNLAPRSNNLPFVSLFSGSETLSSKNARAELFDRVWSQQEKPIKVSQLILSYSKKLIQIRSFLIVRISMPPMKLAFSFIRLIPYGE